MRELPAVVMENVTVVRALTRKTFVIFARLSLMGGGRKCRFNFRYNANKKNAVTYKYKGEVYSGRKDFQSRRANTENTPLKYSGIQIKNDSNLCC